MVYRTVVNDKFENGDLEGWNFKELSSCGESKNMFLGGHCKLGG